ncbi:AAA family ATPase [Streptomyces sp. NPDC059479]|uniref:AAA family ATPase n=1 Tax=Streptomyces sp. NPDC059479 TaxID=3346848 RepID=UPI0036AF5072
MTGRNDKSLSTRSTEWTYGPDIHGDELPLFERRPEQTVLHAVLAELSGGRAGIVTLTGRPGHAQNALLGWAARLARESGLRVLRAQAAPAECELRYGVVAQLMTALYGPAQVGAPAREDGQVPHSLRALTGPDEHEQYEPQPLPGLQRLLRAAYTTPTLLVVEDAQWLDAASQHWLETLVRRLTPDTPLVIMASGSALSAGGPDWLSALPAAPVPTKRLVVHGLSEGGVAAAVRLICGASGDPRFTRAARTATGGNPTALYEVLRRFADHGHEPVAARLSELKAIATAVVGDLVTHALSGLPAEVTTLLRALAVCGDLLPFSLVCAVAGLRAAVGRDLRAMLEAAGLITSVGMKALICPMVKARLLEDMPADERAALHSRAAEQAYRASVNDEDLTHLLLRSPPLGSSWAVPVLRRSFAAALRAENHDNAVACLSRALRESLEPDRRARLSLELAAVEAVCSPEAGDRRLAELVRAGGDVPDGLRIRAVDLALARGNSDAVRRSAAEALHDARDGERDALIALFWLADGAKDDTEPMVPEVPALPDRPSGPAQAGVRAWQLAARGEDRETARELAGAALAGGGPGAALFLPRLAACKALILTDDCTEAATELTALLAAARRDHLPAAVARVLTVRAELHLRTGMLDAAERDAEAAERALPPASSHPLIVPELMALRIATALEAGRHERARSLAAAPAPAGAADGVAWSSLLLARAQLAAVDERWTEALELSKECGRLLLRRGWSNPALLCWRPLAATAVRALGDRAEAARLSLSELTLARRWGTASALGLAELWAGPMTGTGGRPVVRARGATRVLRDSPARLAHAWGLVQLAAAELEEGDRRAAARTADELSAFVTAYPSSRIAVSARRFAERLEEPVGPSPSTLPREWTTLSKVEQCTATFAGRGHGNREIAELLSVSRRTVELRLSNTYRKLRITGREELCELVRTMEGRPTDAS